MAVPNSDALSGGMPGPLPGGHGITIESQPDWQAHPYNSSAPTGWAGIDVLHREQAIMGTLRTWNGLVIVRLK